MKEKRSKSNIESPVAFGDNTDYSSLTNAVFDQYLLSVLMENIPDSIYFKDLESRFIKVNKGKMKNSGVSSEEEILGKTDFDFFGYEHANNARNDELEIIKTGKPIINKVEKENFPDGRIQWVSTTKIPLRDSEGKIIGTFGMSRIITDLVEKEEELKAKNSVIEKNSQQLSNLNQRLRESETRLKNLNRRKDSFFSIISHDLRSPFSSLLGLSEFLVKDAESLSTEEIKNFAQSIHSSSKTVYKLLDNLLEWARIQTGRINITPENIQLNILVEEIADLYKTNCEKKDIEIQIDIDKNICVTADKNMTSGVLRNLISNALKFSFEGGKIIIKSIIKNSCCITTVQDSGTGISENDLQNLFRIDRHISMPGTLQEKGTGLGLILCKEFIELNKGKIWAESTPGKGSSFYFSLPVK